MANRLRSTVQALGILVVTIRLVHRVTKLVGTLGDMAAPLEGTTMETTIAVVGVVIMDTRFFVSSELCHTFSGKFGNRSRIEQAIVGSVETASVSLL